MSDTKVENKWLEGYDRKSFVLYYDWRPFFEKLQPKDAKQLILAAFDYAMTGNKPTKLNYAVEVSFAQMMPVMKRDKDSYIKQTNASRKNGKMGGRPPKNPS